MKKAYPTRTNKIDFRVFHAYAIYKKTPFSMTKIKFQKNQNINLITGTHRYRVKSLLKSIPFEPISVTILKN